MPTLVRPRKRNEGSGTSLDRKSLQICRVVASPPTPPVTALQAPAEATRWGPPRRPWLVRELAQAFVVSATGRRSPSPPGLDLGSWRGQIHGMPTAGEMRHPNYLGLREDKQAEDVVRETESPRKPSTRRAKR